MSETVRSSWRCLSHRVQSAYMLRSMASVIGTSLIVWVTIPYIGAWDFLGVQRVTNVGFRAYPEQPTYPGKRAFYRRC